MKKLLFLLLFMASCENVIVNKVIDPMDCSDEFITRNVLITCYGPTTELGCLNDSYDKVVYVCSEYAKSNKLQVGDMIHGLEIVGISYNVQRDIFEIELTCGWYRRGK